MIDTSRTPKMFRPTRSPAACKQQHRAVVRLTARFWSADGRAGAKSPTPVRRELVRYGSGSFRTPAAVTTNEVNATCGKGTQRGNGAKKNSRRTRNEPPPPRSTIFTSSIYYYYYRSFVRARHLRPRATVVHRQNNNKMVSTRPTIIIIIYSFRN